MKKNIVSSLLYVVCIVCLTSTGVNALENIASSEASPKSSYIPKNFVDKGDVAIREGSLVYVVDEPGIVPCTDLNCDIPVELNIFQLEESGYALTNKINLSKENSGAHNLYKYKNRLASVYFNRRQVESDAVFTTRMNIFDVTKPSEPELWSTAKQNGSLIDSAMRGDKLYTLSLADHAGTDSCDRKFVDPDNASEEQEATRVFEFDLNLSSVSLSDANTHEQQCMHITLYSFYEIALYVGPTGVYVAFSTSTTTYAHRYLQTRTGLVYDGYLTTNLLADRNLVGQQFFERKGTLLVASEYELDGDRQSGVQVFDLRDTTAEGEYKLVSGVTLNEVKTGSSTSITALANSDDKWFIATESTQMGGGSPFPFYADGIGSGVVVEEEASPYSLYVLKPDNFVAPSVVSRYESRDRIDDIFPIQKNLVTLFQGRIGPGFNLVSSMEIIDLERKGRPRSIYAQDLTQGFLQHILPTSEEGTLSASFDRATQQGRLVFPVTSVVYIPPTEIPAETEVSLLGFDFKREKYCFPYFDSCWRVKAGSSYPLALPYIGPEPRMARAFFRENYIDYFLSDEVRTFK